MDVDNPKRFSWRRLFYSIIYLLIAYLILSAIYTRLIASEPKIYVVFAAIPSLNLRSANDTTISFVLLLTNPNKYAGVYYDNISVSLYDGQNRNLSIGNYSFGRFYQGFSKEATRGMQVEEDTLRLVKRLPNGSTIVRFEVATKVRLRGIIGRTGRKGIAIRTNVTINGRKEEITKQIRLKSGGTKAIPSSTILACLAVVWHQQLVAYS